MKILLAAFEHLPIRVGGLAEAAASLGEALAKLGEQVAVLMPSHGFHKKPKELRTKLLAQFSIELGGRQFPTAVYEGTRQQVRLFLLSNEVLDREEVYGPYPALFEKIAHYSKAVPAFLNYYIPRSSEKPDVFHSNDWHPILAAEYVKRYFRIPYVYTIHRICKPQISLDFLSQQGLSDLVNPKFVADNNLQVEPFGALGCKVLNTVSLTYLEEEWDAFFKAYEGKATYVWNGIDAAFWDPEKLENPRLARKERKKKLLSTHGLPDGTFYFYVGRLDYEQKGVEYFLSAIDQVMSNNFSRKEGLRFVILGSGDKKLEDQIRHLEQKYPGHVKGIIGYLRREVTRDYYASADFCVVPSNFEPFGLVQLEAMCLGSIPIGTRVGGINDTVVDTSSDPENATGRLVPPRNAQALAQAIEEGALWVNDKPELIEKLRKNGRKHATTEFTWKTAAERYRKVYADRVSMKISFARYPQAF